MQNLAVRDHFYIFVLTFLIILAYRCGYRAWICISILSVPGWNAWQLTEKLYKCRSFIHLLLFVSPRFSIDPCMYSQLQGQTWFHNQIVAIHTSFHSNCNPFMFIICITHAMVDEADVWTWNTYWVTLMLSWLGCRFDVSNCEQKITYKCSWPTGKNSALILNLLYVNY